jgi:CoA:oxalate CoA-transferase
MSGWPSLQPDSTIQAPPQLALDTCARRLAGLDALHPPPVTVEPALSWCGPAGYPGERRWTEATVQAACGLMEVHGWDAGRPRRVGLEVASVAAGLLAAAGTLAARTGGLRGGAVPRVETSVMSAGLWLVAHHIAAATSGGEPLPSPPGPEPGPPFRSSDGRWFEIEVFDAEDWRSFWRELGAGDADLGRGWTAFRARYYRGLCSLPPGLHQATAATDLARLAQVAAACRVSLCPVRTYAEVLVHPGPLGGHPALGDPPAGALATTVPSAAAGAAGHGLPLEGIRVVEATSRMQGPLAGLLLQMLGAEVVRVEAPGGDVGRMVPPVAGDTGSFVLCYNRAKSAVELDLGRPAGRAELLDLLATSDVFLHNWRPGKASEWGLDRASVATVSPRLVYAEASGWHPVDQNAGLIGTDFLVQAFAGFGDGLNPAEDPPLTSRALLTDTLGALVTCEGMLSGLYLRELTGHPVPVHTSLLQGALAAQAHVLSALASGREAAGRRGGRPAWSLLDRPVTTPGGALMVSVESDDDLTRLGQVCGVQAASSGPRATAEEAVAERLATRPADTWEDALVDAGLAATPVATDLVALASDPRLADLVEPLAASCRAPASPWRVRW